MQTDENGLIYMRARYYSPEIGRFLSLDSVIGSVADSQSLNRYAFCGGNPVMYVDPTGMFAESAFSWYNGLSNTQKILIGSAFMAVGVTAFVASGGTLGAAAAYAVTSVATSAAFSATQNVAFSAIDAWASGESYTTANLLQDAIDGACDGYMWGGIGVGIGGVSSAVSAARVKNNPLENIKYTDKVKTQMELGDYHSFPQDVDAFGGMGKTAVMA